MRVFDRHAWDPAGLVSRRRKSTVLGHWNGEAMASELSDEAILSVLSFARGYDREVLIRALGFSSTKPSRATVEELERLYETEKGHARVAAFYSLCSRLGRAGTRYAVDALSSTYWGLQDMGAGVLAEHGSLDTADPFFRWFERKLKPSDRALGNWDPYHLLTAVRFAVRHDLHQELASLLVKYWTHLAEEERAWLYLHWAGLLDATGTPRAGGQTPPPTSVAVLGTYLFDELHPPQTLEQRLAVEEELAREDAAEAADAYQRALRRRERAGGNR